MKQQMRLVLDTSVIIAAVRSNAGASRRLFGIVAERKEEIRLVTSAALYMEYEAVLKRPEQTAAHRLSPEEIEELLTLVASFTDHVRINWRYRPQLLDEDDEMVLETAINGRAHAIVTHNAKDFLPAAGRFGIAVLSPGRILSEWLKL